MTFHYFLVYNDNVVKVISWYFLMIWYVNMFIFRQNKQIRIQSKQSWFDILKKHSRRKLLSYETNIFDELPKDIRLTSGYRWFVLLVVIRLHEREKGKPFTGNRMIVYIKNLFGCFWKNLCETETRKMFYPRNGIEGFLFQVHRSIHLIIIFLDAVLKGLKKATVVKQTVCLTFICSI